MFYHLTHYGTQRAKFVSFSFCLNCLQRERLAAPGQCPLFLHPNRRVIDYAFDWCSSSCVDVVATQCIQLEADESSLPTLISY